MKRIVLLAALALYCPFLFSQTLFTYGNTAVSKEEFLRAYNKNKGADADKEKALREYLELYTNFKLKVKAAKDMRLDTLPQLTNDLEAFRGQVNETYMSNDEALEGLVNEAFTRSQKDIHVIHFFTAFNKNQARPGDSLKAVKAMQELYSGLQGGRSDYEKLAADISAKYLPVKASDIGYITAFSVPYEYENIIYGLKNGEASKPYLSKNGLHIFKVVNERKAVGKWRVAQILILVTPGGDAGVNSKQAELRADSVYQKLKAGADFVEMVKEYSDDKLTYGSGGVLPEFSAGKYEAPFEDAVFALAKDGDISKPIATQYGFHIVKRLDVTPVPDNKSDVSYMYEVKQKVLQDTRANLAKDIFVKSVIKTVGYKKNPAVKDAELFRYADSIVANPGRNAAKVFPISNKIIFSGKTNIKGSDWLNFIREYKTNPELYRGESNPDLLEKFLSLISVDYYKTNLEQYSPEFHYQMDEFKDGNLLFEVMERKVWSTANADSAGLLKYYNQHKTKYLWTPSADVIIFSASNKRSADKAVEELQKGTSWKKIAEESSNTIQADSGRYEMVQIVLPENTTAKEGMLTPINVNPTDGTAGFVKILHLHPGNEQRSFEEAKGLVINDYQNIIEQKWVEELRKKYPVTVNEAVFQSLLK